MVMLRFAVVLILFFSFAAHAQEDARDYLSKAQAEFMVGRVIDARETLLEATREFPEDHRPHLILGRYYLYDVRNFRVAFKYISNAKRLLIKKYGEDYSSYPSLVFDELRLVLLLEIDCRSDLDDYEGSLQLIEEFEKHFYDQSVAATKAWLLMKEGKLEESYREAQKGVFLSGGTDTRALNVLGIVQSIRGERQKAISTFQEILSMLTAQGLIDRTSTPLNNMGEVYREIFEVDEAEDAWSRVVGLPDGCDHVLPSLNLAHLYIDQLKLFRAEQVLSSFEACFAADGLKDDTEHRTLIKLARGKLAQRMGNFESAKKLLSQARDQHQWFGKIGTTVDDMRLATLASHSNLYWAQANWELVRPDGALIPYFSYVELKLKSWWYARQAVTLALNSLMDFEDLYVRNTDAMIEYPTLGRWLSVAPSSSLNSRLRSLTASDERSPAHGYYKLYQGHEGQLSAAELRSLYKSWPADDALGRAEALALLISKLSSSESKDLRIELFSLSPAHLKEFGFKLPVQLAEKLSGQSCFESYPGSRYKVSVENGTYRLLDSDRVLLLLQDVSPEEFADKVFTHHSDYIRKE